MARRTTLLATSLLLLIAALPTAAADGCPASASGFQPGPVNSEWEPGDPIPSGDLLWEQTVVQGAIAEGTTVEQLAEDLGLASVEELYAFALEGWRGLDKNDDGLICFKPFPEHQNGHPAYFSNFVDSNAKANK
ncbi:MAG: hypothetical protein ACR2K4_08420 [Candidatus Limnocylindria bacterium]